MRSLELWWHSATHKGLWESSLNFEHRIPGGPWCDDCVILHYGVTQIVCKATTSTKHKRMCKWVAWWLCNTPLWCNTNCWQSNNFHKTKNACPNGRHDGCVILHYGVTQIVGKTTTSTKKKCMCKWVNKAFPSLLLQIQPPNKINTKSEPQVTSSSPHIQKWKILTPTWLPYPRVNFVIK